MISAAHQFSLDLSYIVSRSNTRNFFSLGTTSEYPDAGPLRMFMKALRFDIQGVGFFCLAVRHPLVVKIMSTSPPFLRLAWHKR